MSAMEKCESHVRLIRNHHRERHPGSTCCAAKVSTTLYGVALSGVISLNESHANWKG